MIIVMVIKIVFKGKKSKIRKDKCTSVRFLIHQDMKEWIVFFFNVALVHDVEKGSREPRMIADEWSTSTSALNISIYGKKKSIEENKRRGY
jgi:hypothetical protein